MRGILKIFAGQAGLFAAFVLAYMLHERFKPPPPRAETPQGTVWMLRGLTYCAEAWNKAPFKSPADYLKANGVAWRRMAVSRSDGGGSACRSCDCASGEVLNLLVEQADAARVARLGFVPAGNPPSAEEAAAGWRSD